jgi:hypothetical protein
VGGKRVLDLGVFDEDVPREMPAEIIRDEEIVERTERTQLFVDVDIEFIEDMVRSRVVEEKSVYGKETRKASGIRPEAG